MPWLLLLHLLLPLRSSCLRDRTFVIDDKVEWHLVHHGDVSLVVGPQTWFLGSMIVLGVIALNIFKSTLQGVVENCSSWDVAVGALVGPAAIRLPSLVFFLLGKVIQFPSWNEWQNFCKIKMSASTMKILESLTHELPHHDFEQGSSTAKRQAIVHEALDHQLLHLLFVVH